MRRLLFFSIIVASSVVADYTPLTQICPLPPFAELRNAGTPQNHNQTLAGNETVYIAERRAITTPAVQAFVNQFGKGVVYAGDITTVPQDLLPTIALSFSGGGFRAALFGAGVLAALDSRNTSAVKIGTGGLLQSASYISGLSGGSWFLSSLVFNNLPDSYVMVLGDNSDRTNWPGWFLLYDLENPSNNSVLNAEYAKCILNTVNEKFTADYQVTVDDFWARALSYHFLPGTTADNFFDLDTSGHGASITFSSAVNLPAWKSFSLPFPIIVSDVYSVNTTSPNFPGGVVPLQNVVYESSPFEYGSYDPMLAYFMPMTYLGTNMTKGVPTNTSSCTTNFDNQGYVLGTSSSIWHGLNVTNATEWNQPDVQNFFIFLQGYGSPGIGLDVSNIPNPFLDVFAPNYQDGSQTYLRGTDGGSDAENDPLAPLQVPARNIDFILIADASADTGSNRPDGNAIAATVARSKILPSGTVNLPPMPESSAIFISEGLNTRPTFFGCAGTPPILKGQNVSSPYPMAVYLPNDDPKSITNTSTAQRTYSDAEASDFLDASFNIATTGFSVNPIRDPQWASCLACAVVERTRGRTGVDQTDLCTNCFARYCWSGVDESFKFKGTESKDLVVKRRNRGLRDKMTLVKTEKRRGI